MLQALLLAALAVQDPKPAKTVEDRIKELSERLAVLDKKATDLAAENLELQRRLAVQEQSRESIAKAAASLWMVRHTGGLSLDDAKKSAIEGLWVSWTREDMVKPADPGTWKSREETLRKELTREQAAIVEKSVRSEIDSAMDFSIASYGKQAQIAPEREPVFRKTVRSRITLAEPGLIPQAHAGAGVSWSGLYPALEGSLPDLTGVLTPEEHGRLSKLLARWGPRNQKDK